MAHTKMAHVLALGVFAFMTAAAQAELLEIPYTGGKKAGTVVITKVSSTQMSPDTVKIGAAMIRLTLKAENLIAVCGAKPTIVAQFVAPFATVSQTSDTSTNWNAYNTMPTSGLVPLDSIDIWRSGGVQPAWRAPGFDLFSEGSGRSCTNTEYLMHPRWNRVVFMPFGTGVGYRLKVSFQTLTGSTENPTPMIFNAWLNTVTMHYVLNAGSSDLSGAPVSLRRPESRVNRITQGTKDWRTVDLYNPLGMKIRREPGRFEAVVPLVR